MAKTLMQQLEEDRKRRQQTASSFAQDVESARNSSAPTMRERQGQVTSSGSVSRPSFSNSAPQPLSSSQQWNKTSSTSTRPTNSTPNAAELNRRYVAMSKQAGILEGLAKTGRKVSDQSYDQHLRQFQQAYTDFEDYQKKYQDYTSEETTRKRREETQRQLDQQLEAQRVGQQVSRFANYIPQEYRQQMREQGAQADQQEIDRLRRQLEQDDEILAGYEQRRETERLMGLDLDALKSELDAKTAQQEELWQNYLSGTRGISWGATRESLDMDLAREIEDLQNEYNKAYNLQWRQTQGEQYEALANQSDFSANSQYLQSNDPEAMLSQLRQQESDLIYRINNDPSAPASLSTQLNQVQQQIRDYQALQKQIGSTYHDMTGENDAAQRFQYATDQERAVYYYLVNTGRYQEAADYADYLDYNLNERRQAQRVENAQEFARNHPVLSTLASVPQSLASGVGQLDLMVQKMENTGSGKPVDFNTAWQDPYFSSTTIENTISQDLNEKYGTLDESIPIIGGMGVGNLYQIGTSALDSAAVLALTAATGLPPIVGTSLLGGAAATAASHDAHNRGLSDSQAIATGIMAGIWETMFEYVSIDNLLKPSMSAGSLRSALGAAAKQAGIEASEEFLTTAANTLSDLAINGDQSQIMGDYQRYLAQGDSASQAAAKTFGGALNSALQDALAGAISGGVMGGGKAALGTMLPTRTTSTQTQARPAVEQAQALASRMEAEADSARAAEGQGQAVETLPMATQQAQGEGQQVEMLPMVEQPATRQIETLPMVETADSGLYTTSVDTDPSTHTPEENARIQEYTRSTDSRIVSFIKRIGQMMNSDRKNRQYQKLDAVTPRQTEDLYRITGVDTTGYTHEIKGSAITHIQKRHGENGTADQTMRDINDIARIPYVLENYDSVEPLSAEDGDAEVTTSYNNSDNTLAPMVRFSKKVNGTYYVVEAVPDSKAKVLGIVSAYMLKSKGSTAQVPTMPAKPTRSITSETSLENNASSSQSIPYTDAPVNQDAVQQKAFPDTQQVDTIGIQFHSEPGMSEGGWAISGTRMAKMVRRANEVVSQALASRELTRDQVQQSVSDLLAREFGMTSRDASTLAEQFARQYQAAIDQGSARLYQEMQEGDGPRQASQANNTWQNATQMTPEEREMAGMEPGGEAYTTRSEAYSNEQARALIDRLGWDGAYQYLMQNDTWNPADVKAAVEVGRHLLSQARSETDPKAKEALYEQAGQIGMRYQQDRSAAGRSLQASAQYASDPVLDAIGRTAKILKDSQQGQDMTPTQQAEAISESAQAAQEIEDAKNRAQQNNDGTPLIDLIERYAKERGITKTVVRGKTRDVSGIIHKILEGSSQENLYQFAQASLDGYIMDKYGDPAGLGQRLKTIQVLSHLFNPRTWMRNLVGNATFGTVDSAANRIAATMDILIGKRTGTRSTAAGPNFFSREAMSAKKRALAQSVAAVYLDLDLNHEANRYGQVSQRTFRMNSDSKVAALTRAMSKLERNLSYALTSTDQFAKGGVQATQQARIQQLLDAGQIDPERLGVDVIPEEYAAWRGKELAKYRTFQDNSKLAVFARSAHDLGNMLAGVGDSGRTKSGFKVKAFGLGDLLMPYPGVPGNIASRALEYSPVGLAKGIVDLSQVLKSGKNATVQNQSQAVLELSRGITGSALIGLAAFAAANGIIRSTDDDDNLDEKKLNSAEGVSGIQVNLSALLRGMSGGSTEWQKGDRLAALDYLQPVNTWLALGCFVDSYLSGDKDYDAFTASVDAFGKSIEDFPVLQTIQNIVDDVQYSGVDPLAASLQESASSIMSSVVPSFVRNVSTASDPYQRDTTSGEYGAVSLYNWISQSTGMKSEFLKALAEFFDNTLKVSQSVSTIMSAVPGLRQTLPMKLDNYGQPMGYTGSRPLDVANALVLPGSVYSYNQRELTKVLAQVSAYTGTDNFYPSRNPVKIVEYNGTKHEMTFDQRQEYQKTYGTVYYDMANELMQSQQWQDADPMTRADMLSKIEEIASAQARVNFMASIGQDYTGSDSASLIAKLDEMAAGGVDFATYYDWKNRISSMGGDTKQDDLLKALSGSGLSEQQQITVYFDLGGYSISEKKLSQGATVGLDEADLQRWRYRVDQAKSAGQDNSQLLELLRQSSDLSTDQKNQIGKLFLSDVIVIPDEVDVDFTNDTTFTLSQLPDSAQDRYEAFAQDYLTPQQWSDIYTKYSGYKNKAQKIAAMVADGYSQSDAETLYSWMSKSIDDSYYVGKMSDTARYYWQNGVEAENLMSAKQWLTFTDEYAGVDYQTALEAMQDAGYAADYADILARLLSQM